MGEILAANLGGFWKDLNSRRPQTTATIIQPGEVPHKAPNEKSAAAYMIRFKGAQCGTGYDA